MFTYQTVPYTNARTPNSTLCFTDYYFSYNSVDNRIYGCDTTSIVLGQMQLFLILNGDHRQALSDIAQNDGLQGCIDYFIDSIDQANHRSEHVLAYSGLDLLGQSNIDRIAQVIQDLPLSCGRFQA